MREKKMNIRDMKRIEVNGWLVALLIFLNLDTSFHIITFTLIHPFLLLSSIPPSSFPSSKILKKKERRKKQATEKNIFHEHSVK